MEQENNKKDEFTEDDKLEEAKTTRKILQGTIQYPQERANEASIEFIKLEVQLATLLLGLIAVLWNVYTSPLPLGSHLQAYIKISFAVVLFLLIGSIMLGLLYLKIVEKHWDRITATTASQYRKWREVIRKETSYEKALAFQEGTNANSGPMIYTPEWPWILQTVLLSTSLAIIFFLAVKLITTS
jgi:hypothetical protein